MATIRLLLVDDHVLVRETLKERLDRDPRFQVAGLAENADAAIDLAFQTRPDIILMDIDMPGLLCFDAARRILDRLPEVRLLFLSAHTHDHYIDQALKIGAMGYVTKHDSPDLLMRAIEEVAANRAFFSAPVQARIVFEADGPRLAHAGHTRASRLTPREIEVLQYIASGLAKKEIASIMKLSQKTVEKHADNLMAKLDIHDRVTLTRFAIREGLAHP